MAVKQSPARNKNTTTALGGEGARSKSKM